LPFVIPASCSAIGGLAGEAHLVVADGCLEGMARPARVFWILSGITFRADTESVGGFA